MFEKFARFCADTRQIQASIFQVFRKLRAAHLKTGGSQSNLRFAAHGGKHFLPMRNLILILLGVAGLTLRVFCADAEYKLVRIETLTNALRVRLPLTDVTGKVRVKEKSSDDFGLPVAPSKVPLGKKHYLEWQIGYDLPNTNSPSAVPEIQFIRNGETKYGHELSKIIFEAVRLGLISTNDLVREIEVLRKIQPGEFEESQPVQVEVATNAAADGFQSAVQRLPQFTKTTPHGWVQIQLKQKQRAVGYQAMVRSEERRVGKEC